MDPNYAQSRFNPNHEFRILIPFFKAGSKNLDKLDYQEFKILEKISDFSEFSRYLQDFHEALGSEIFGGSQGVEICITGIGEFFNLGIFIPEIRDFLIILTTLSAGFSKIGIFLEQDIPIKSHLY